MRSLKFSPELGRPYWQTFRAVSNTPVVRSVILIPIVGYWIIFNDALVCNFTSLARSLVQSVPEEHCKVSSPPIRLFAIYFGLCWIAVASTLYQVLCPPEIKRFPDPTEYNARYGPNISSTELDRVEKALVEGDDRSRAEFERITQYFPTQIEPTRESSGRISTVGLDVNREAATEYRREILQAHYDLCNRLWPLARLLALSCYMLGVIFLLAPSLDVFWRVLKVLWRWAFA